MMAFESGMAEEALSPSTRVLEAQRRDQRTAVAEALRLLGFTETPFDRDDIAWRHPRTGTAISVNELGRLKGPSQLAELIHFSAYESGMEKVKRAMRAALEVR